MRKLFAPLVSIVIIAIVIVLVNKGPFLWGRNNEKITAAESIHLNEVLVNEDPDSLSRLDKKMFKSMNDWKLAGMSLAISRNDSLLYVKGYGMADNGEPMTPGHILRVASVSKLITAVGIMKLSESGKLSLEDKVFGEDGILCDSLYTKFIGSRMNDYGKISVEHLLRHQGGFRRDPMFGIKDIMDELQLQDPPDDEDLLKLILSSSLRFEPGTWQRYSNAGYFLLGKIIEKASGEPYEQYMRDSVLIPAGCFDMHIGGNYYEDRLPGEVRYHAHLGDGQFIPDWRSPTDSVERCYGGNDISMLGSAGGWVCSPAELSRLVASIDNNPIVPDILSEESINKMVEYFDENTYSLGWVDTDPQKGWKRTGTLSGTHALILRYPDGECWTLVTNTSTYRGPGQTKNAQSLFDECRALYSDKLPERNLFFSQEQLLPERKDIQIPK